MKKSKTTPRATAPVGDVLQMKFAPIPVSKINPAPYNPRKELRPGDPEYESIKLSILTHGMVDPLVWNQHNGILIGGHQRLNILLKEFKAKMVWCSIRSIKDPKAERSLNVALNKNHGEWDFLKLQEVALGFKDDAIDDPLRGSMGFTVLGFKEVLEFKPVMTEGDVIGKIPTERLGTYQEGTIKQIVLYYTATDFENRLARLEKIGKDHSLDDNTARMDFLLEFYEKHRSKTKTR